MKKWNRDTIKGILAKRMSLSMCLAALLIWSTIPATGSRNGGKVKVGQPASFPQDLQLSPAQRHARLVKNFKPARDLLLRKGVPFEPELLISTRWKELLAPYFAQMPEMHTSRRLTKRLSGVQLADILYLPETVELTGDTIIIANQVIFEGRNAVIKGNYNVVFFPVVTAGVLGTTLEPAMNEQGVRFATVDFKSSAPLKRFAPHLLEEDWSLTIDTSGKGYKEWLEEQKNAQSSLSKKPFLRTSFQGGTTDHSGGAGATGLTGDDGVPKAFRVGTRL